MWLFLLRRLGQGVLLVSLLFLCLDCSRSLLWEPPNPATSSCNPEKGNFATHPDWQRFLTGAKQDLGGSQACLQVAWGETFLQKSQTTLVRFSSIGEIKSVDGSEYTSLPLPPVTQSQSLRMRLFLFPPSVSQHPDICSGPMNNVDYDCLASSQQSSCLMFLEMQPSNPHFSGRWLPIPNHPDSSCVMFLRPEQKEAPVEPDTATDAGPQDLTSEAPEQTPKTQWLMAFGGDVEDRVHDMVVGAEGDIYITGVVEGLATFDKQIVGFGGKDIFVAKLSSQGEFKWVRLAGSRQDDAAYSITLDPQNNVYISGTAAASARFGTLVLSDIVGAGKPFVAKLNSKGDWLWSMAPSGVGGGEIVDIVHNQKDTLYLSGVMRGENNFGSIKTFIPLAEIWRQFVAAMTPDGSWKWVTQTKRSRWTQNENPGYYTEAPRLAVSDQDELFLVGSFEETFTLGTTTLQAKGPYNIYTASLDSKGSWKWVNMAASSSEAFATNIALNSLNQLFVTGRFRENLTFGQTQLTAGSYDSNQIFVAAMSQGGVWQWALQSSGPGQQSSFGLAIDSSGNPYIAGMLEKTSMFAGLTAKVILDRSLFVAKVNASQKQWEWVSVGGGTPFGQTPVSRLSTGDLVTSIAIPSSGDLYLAGTINEPMWGKLKATPVTKAFHAFVAKNVNRP